MIRPEEALPASVLEFVPATMRAMIASGESPARRHLDTGLIVEPVSRELFERVLAEMETGSACIRILATCRHRVLRKATTLATRWSQSHRCSAALWLSTSQ